MRSDSTHACPLAIPGTDYTALHGRLTPTNRCMERTSEHREAGVSTTCSCTVIPTTLFELLRDVLPPLDIWKQIKQSLCRWNSEERPRCDPPYLSFWLWSVHPRLHIMTYAQYWLSYLIRRLVTYIWFYFNQICLLLHDVESLLNQLLHLPVSKEHGVLYFTKRTLWTYSQVASSTTFIRYKSS